MTYTGTPDKLVGILFGLDKDKKYELREYVERKTRDQNSYVWKLITEIGNVLRKSKEEVYLEMLKDYGQSEIVSMLSSINPVGFFKYYEEIGTGIVNNKEFTHYKVFKGSSEFNRKEMSIFIDGVVQECHQLGIPTLTPDEIAQLKFLGIE
jgi:hypothetical protein